MQRLQGGGSRGEPCRSCPPSDTGRQWRLRCGCSLGSGTADLRQPDPSRLRLLCPHQVQRVVVEVEAGEVDRRGVVVRLGMVAQVVEGGTVRVSDTMSVLSDEGGEAAPATRPLGYGPRDPCSGLSSAG